MRKRTALVPALLLAGLVVAVIGATAALRLVGNSAFGPSGKALTQADVRRSLAQQAPAAAPGQHSRPASRSPGAASPSAARGAAATPPRAPGHVTTSGGTVFATCASGRVSLASWIPAQGYGTDGVSQGPAQSAWVRFKSSATEVTVTAACVAGQPHFATSADDRGGGSGGGSGGRSGSGH